MNIQKARTCLTLAAVVAACASGRDPLPREDPSSQRYFGDAQRCIQQHQLAIRSKIPLGGGPPSSGLAGSGSAADILVPMGTDPQPYRLCMQGRGWNFDPDQDPYLASIEACRRSAQVEAGAATSDEGVVRIRGDSDAGAFEACLKESEDGKE